MNIKVGKYTIKSIPQNIVLMEEKTVKEGENKGKKYQDSIGFYGKLEHCLDSLLEKEINESQATSIKALLKDMGRVRELILQNMVQAQ